MRIRRASWGKAAWSPAWRGWSLAFITRNHILNFELHYERRTSTTKEKA